MNLDEIKQLDEKYYIGCYGTRFFSDIHITKASGSVLTDSNGKEYIDCVSGIASVNLGHNNPLIEERVLEYKKNCGVDHLSNLFYIESQAEYAASLAKVVPISIAKIFFCNSGAEATNGAIKFASKNNGHWLVSASSSFHGRYGASLAATGQQKYQKGFEKTLPRNTKLIEFNNTVDLEQITDDTYAVIIEVIQAEGGIIQAKPDYLEKLQQRCNNTGALLIVDEVQTGFGRTGKLFGTEHYSVFPDAICMAKGIANGYPFGAIAFGPQISRRINPGEHASTYGGNAEGCVRAQAVLDIFSQQNILENVKNMEQLFYSMHFENIPHVKYARGKGLLLGVELDTADNRKKVIDACKNDGVLFCASGKSVIRCVPPLTIAEEQFGKAMEVLKKNINSL